MALAMAKGTEAADALAKAGVAAKLEKAIRSARGTHGRLGTAEGG